MLTRSAGENPRAPEPESQLTLVAFLGRKPPGLARVLAACRRRLEAALGDAFGTYPQEQIHATIVGLERVPGSRRDNANLARLRGHRAAMDLEGFLSDLLAGSALPGSIRFGGFAPGERPFTSRGQSPRERTFSIQGDKAVLLGWPILAGERDPYPPSLDRLRRRAGDFNILHAYHAAPTAVDNDFYLRLGTVGGRPAPGDRDLADIVAALRAELAAGPVTVPLTLDDLRVAVYRDPTLSPRSTRAVTLEAACRPGAAEALFG